VPDPHRTKPVTVLLVEDDATIGSQVTEGLTAAGYTVRWLRTASAARTQILNAQPEVILLDLGLPDGDGVDLARLARTDRPEVLIMLLTARAADIDVIAGLDAGADDYLIKPFSLSVLLARLRAQLRRHPQEPTTADPIAIGDLTIDTNSRLCRVGNTEIVLRTKEFDLLVLLATHVGQAVSRQELMEQIWDENWYGSTKTLDVTVANLRRHLTIPYTNAAPLALPEIATLRGHGYRLDAPP
jgi:DNA-binding response OmpR family regulator